MESTEIQMPDPVTTKSVTFEQYKTILSVHYMGALSVCSTDAAFFSMLKGRKPPACIQSAFRAWRRSIHKSQLPQTIAKNDAVQCLYAVLVEFGTATVNQLVDETGMSKAAINTYLFNLMGNGLVTRTWKAQNFIYEAKLPVEKVKVREKGQVAA